MKRLTIILIVLTIVNLGVFASGQTEAPVMEAPAMEGPAMEMEPAMDSDMKPAMGPLHEFDGMDKAMMSAAEQPTVLFFHASWCPTCKAAMKDLEANVSKLKGYTIYITDYDTTEELQKKYGVTYQHTFVQIDSEGNAITVWNGGASQEILDNTMMKEM